MNLTLGFSTCPNDTFIFDAMVHNKVDTEGLNFSLIMADVEELNREAFNNSIDITKISYHAFAYISKNYKILDAGSALGNNNGPLLISKTKIYSDEISNLKIAIPGKYTTANLLLSIAYPKTRCKKEYVFSDIEEAVYNNEVDAGLIIHENRFTYQERGFKKIIDLGEFWENKTKLPIPLGGIAVNRNLSENIQQKINRVLQHSIEFAYKNPNESLKFIKQYAQEIDDNVMLKHIDLYVNKFSIDLGTEGKNAIKKLYSIAENLKLIPKQSEDIFI